MQIYVNYHKREITTPYENPPIGVILCSKKNNAVVQFIIPEDNKDVLISKFIFILIQR